MNFRIFSKYIITLGLIIIFVGLFHVLSNLPLSGKSYIKKYPAKSPSIDTPEDRKKYWNDFLKLYSRPSIVSLNLERELNRAKGGKLLIIGAIVLFIGIGILVSSKESSIKSNKTGLPKSLLTKIKQKDTSIFCTQCGKPNGKDSKFCQECGDELEYE
jgi:uncharacterized membrane protein